MTIAEVFATGLPADVALAAIAAEALTLHLLNRRGRGPRLAALWPFLLAGAFLMLALRAALVDAPWYCVAAALAASGVAHAFDVWRRARA